MSRTQLQKSPKARLKTQEGTCLCLAGVKHSPFICIRLQVWQAAEIRGNKQIIFIHVTVLQ